MTGTTIAVAESIQKTLADAVDETRCIDKVNSTEFKPLDFVILGGSTGEAAN